LLTNADSVAFSVEFDEAVVGFSAQDLVVSMDPAGSGAVAITGFETDDSTTFSVTVTGPGLQNYEGELSLSFAQGATVAGLTGNPLNDPSAVEAVYDIDTLLPEIVSVEATPGAVKIGETSEITVTFSEPVSGVTLDDFTYNTELGALSSLTPNAAGDVWTATFTPEVDTQDVAAEISLTNSVFTDAATNEGAGAAGDTASVDIDTQAPESSTTASDSVLVDAEVADGALTLTVSFDEAMDETVAPQVVLFTGAGPDATVDNLLAGDLGLSVAQEGWVSG